VAGVCLSGGWAAAIALGDSRFNPFLDFVFDPRTAMRAQGNAPGKRASLFKAPKLGIRIGDAALAQPLSIKEFSHGGVLFRFDLTGKAMPRSLFGIIRLMAARLSDEPQVDVLNGAVQLFYDSARQLRF
jgi:hypothetical protein